MRIIIIALCVWTCCAAADGACEHPDIKDGFVVPYQPNYADGVTVQYACNEGLRPPYKTWWKDIRCKDGQWDLKPPDLKCIIVSCLTPKFANAEAVNQLFEFYAEGDRVKFKCKKGYDLRVEEINYAQCVAGRWDPPDCVRQPNTCGLPPAVPNLVIKSADGDVFVNGDTIEYQCEEGFRLNGPRTRTCTNSQWSSAPTCTKTSSSQTKPKTEVVAKEPSLAYHSHVSQCGTRPEVFDGDVSEVDNGMALAVQCFRFYRRKGPEKVYCDRNQWTTQPVCITPCTLDPNIPLYYYKERFLEDGRTLKEDYCTNRREYVDVKCVNERALYKGCGRRDF